MAHIGDCNCQCDNSTLSTEISSTRRIQAALMFQYQ